MPLTALTRPSPFPCPHRSSGLCPTARTVPTSRIVYTQAEPQSYGGRSSDSTGRGGGRGSSSSSRGGRDDRGGRGDRGVREDSGPREMKVDGGDYDDYGLAEPRDRRRAPGSYGDRRQSNDYSGGRGGRGGGRGGFYGGGSNFAGQRTTYAPAPVDTYQPTWRRSDEAPAPTAPPPEESPIADEATETAERLPRRPASVRPPPRARVPLRDRPAGIYDADEDEEALDEQESMEEEQRPMPARDERGRIIDEYASFDRQKRPNVPKPLPLVLPIVRINDGDKGTFFSSSSWQQLGLTETLVGALAELGIRRPSHVQVG